MFIFDDHKCYQMPGHFGGCDYDPNLALHYHDVAALYYTYTTERKQLEEYLPKGFELIKPELHVFYLQNREIDWMAGSKYNLIAIGAPARFTGRRDRLDGLFALVVWENKAVAIMEGRELFGIPKIFADIEDLHINDRYCATNASYEGHTFLRLEMTREQPVAEPQLAQVKAQVADIKLFGWRYIPKIGGPGADLSQPTLYPQGIEANNAWTGRGIVQWNRLNWEDNPIQWHIIAALAQLPIIELAPAIMMKGAAILRNGQGRVLE